MTSDPNVSNVERTRRAIGQSGYLAAMLGLLTGIVLFVAGQPAMSRGVLGATLGILLLMPVVNVLAILAEEVRRRDWSFVVVAAVVLGLLAFNVVRRLFG